LKPDFSGVLEWGQPVWVAEARWAGFDGDSTHAHIYWQDRNRVSVEQNVRFPFNTVTVRLCLRFPSNTNITTSTSLPAVTSTDSTQQVTAYLPMSPVSKATIPSSSAKIPAATDSGEEEMSDEDEAQVEEELKTPEQMTVPLPPSAPKKAVPPPLFSASVALQLPQMFPSNSYDTPINSHQDLTSDPRRIFVSRLEASFLRDCRQRAGLSEDCSATAASRGEVE